MHTFKKITALLFMCFLATGLQAQKQTATLFETQVYRFTSAIDSLPYVVYIHLPNDTLLPNKKYPVLYVTDAQYFLTPLYGGYGSLHYDGFVPDLIRVGITWPDNYETNRVRDFTAVPSPAVPGLGNAKQFLSVIKNEVIKYIESKYPVDTTDRALYGTSLGGFFAVYTLFSEPTLFQKYIIASPSVEIDSNLAFRMERDFAQKNKTLNAKIYFCLGEYEEAMDMEHSFDKFVQQVANSKYKGLVYKRHIVESMGHSGTSTIGGIMGMQYIYSKPDFIVSTAILDQYAGRYIMPGGDTTLLVRVGNHLFAKNGPQKVELVARSPAVFHLNGVNAEITFKSSANKVTGFDMNFGDAKLSGTKIK